MNAFPSHPEVDALLDRLVRSVQSILGSRVTGIYVFGSLASGDFDASSDIDVLVVIEEPLSAEQFGGLGRMHEQLKASASNWAAEIEASYIPKRAIRRHDPSDARHPHVHRGKKERLTMMPHDSDWVVQRHVVRERGATLTGPAPASLIDPVTPNDLRGASSAILHRWAGPLLSGEDGFQHRGHHSYIALSVCRMLYTLEYGTVVSKRAAAQWAQRHLDSRWAALARRAWRGRLAPMSDVIPEEATETLEFIRYAIDHVAKEST